MKIKNNEMRRINVKKTLVLVIILGLFLANFVVIASASPDLTEAGKRYIAENFGIGGCFVYSELTWTRVDKDGETTIETGGTVKLINRLTVPMIVDYIIINSSNYTYAELKAANGNNDIDLDDITWMAEHDGYPPGEDQYCICVTPTPTQIRDAGIEKMALTENCKKYIAQYLGIVQGTDFCFSDAIAATVKYWDAKDESHMGSTLDAVATIKMFGGYSYEDLVAETGLIDAAKLTSENGGVDLTDGDIVWIANHSDGVDKYCYSPDATPTPIPSTPSPTPTPTLTPSPTPTQTPSPIYAPAPTHTPTSSPISSPSPTPTLVDSDGDGVPDRYDYAPYDPNVQTKSDIKPETTPTPQPPGFEVPFVIVGLLLVAYLIKRRKVK